MNNHGAWSGCRKRLEFPDFAECSMFSCGCSQKVILPNGNILIPITFGYFDRKDRQVSSLLCSFNRNTLTPLKRGNILENPVGRGLLEPSIVEFRDKYYMTLRAEDERGYLSVSDDGLNWTPIKPWQWDNGDSVEDEHHPAALAETWREIISGLYPEKWRKRQHYALARSIIDCRILP